MILVAGPRIDPQSLDAPAGVEVRAFVPDLDRHLAACDLALVQGGLTTCMELTAAGTPFLYFPLKNHFEQNFHVAHRLDRYGAGRRMEFATSTPEMIAEAMVAALKQPANFKPVEADGAARAARMLAEMCQSAFKFDPVSASNFDPFERRVLAVALASSELAGVAETWRARAV